jgi:hypothetical protein
MTTKFTMHCRKHSIVEHDWTFADAGEDAPNSKNVPHAEWRRLLAMLNDVGHATHGTLYHDYAAFRVEYDREFGDWHEAVQKLNDMMLRVVEFIRPYGWWRVCFTAHVEDGHLFATFYRRNILTTTG